MEIVTLQEIDRNNLEDIHVLIRQLSTGATLPNLEQFNSFLNSDQLVFFVAEDAGRIIGMLSLVYFRIPTGLRARIEDVVVLTEYRRQGIAKKLNEAAIEHYKNSGARTLALTSNSSRAAANNLYKNLGFEIRNTNVYQYANH